MRLATHVTNILAQLGSLPRPIRRRVHLITASRLVLHILVATLVLAQAGTAVRVRSGTRTLQTREHNSRRRILLATGLAKARLRELAVLA